MKKPKIVKIPVHFFGDKNDVERIQKLVDCGTIFCLGNIDITPIYNKEDKTFCRTFTFKLFSSNEDEIGKAVNQ